MGTPIPIHKLNIFYSCRLWYHRIVLYRAAFLRYNLVSGLQSLESGNSIVHITHQKQCDLHLRIIHANTIFSSPTSYSRLFSFSRITFWFGWKMQHDTRQRAKQATGYTTMTNRPILTITTTSAISSVSRYTGSVTLSYQKRSVCRYTNTIGKKVCIYEILIPNYVVTNIRGRVFKRLKSSVDVTLIYDLKRIMYHTSLAPCTLLRHRSAPSPAI